MTSLSRETKQIGARAKPLSKAATIHDVARLAGTSRGTVTRVLSESGYSSPAARIKVLEAAKQLGYQPNSNAQRLAKGRSNNTIGLFSVSDLGVGTRQAWGITNRLEEMGFEVESHATPLYVNHFEDRQLSLVNKVRRQNPGAILFSSEIAGSALDELRRFQDEGGVVVSYGKMVGLDCDQVILDITDQAYLATLHLLGLGHRDIGFCFHGLHSQESGELVGFSRALAEFGVEVQEKWLFTGGDYEKGGARLAEAYLSWPEKPTAFCIINDVSSSAFINVLAQNGVRVPDDISVVGFDDSYAAHYALVPLTSISYPLEEITHHVVEMTVRRLQGFSGAPCHAEVSSHLVERQSSAPLNLLPTRDERSRDRIR
jgi:DNA-binding LacI/PurR family transcriptional regulator